MDKSKFLKSKAFYAIILVIIAVLAFSIAGNAKKKHLIQNVFEAYSDNANSAFKKYDGKKVTFIAEVESVSSSLDYITVRSADNDDIPSSFESFKCLLNDEKCKKKAEKLKSGDKIKIKVVLHMEELLGILDVKVDTEKIS